MACPSPTASTASLPAPSSATTTSSRVRTAPLAAVLSSPGVLGLACSALPAGSLTGKIALISRGTCTFSQKIRDAQDAGAVGAIIVNNVAGDPIAMGLGGIPNEPTIFGYM